MYEAGARIFIEAGPRGNLTAFVDDILRGKPHLAVAVDQYRRPALTTLNNALGLLAALHVPLDLNPLYVRRSPRLLSAVPSKTGSRIPTTLPARCASPSALQNFILQALSPKGTRGRRPRPPPLTSRVTACWMRISN